MQPWAMVGRSTEIARGSEVLDAGRGVVIVGPAGVGKTRLAHELASRSELDDTQVVRLIASRVSTDIPLAAFVTVLSPDIWELSTDGSSDGSLPSRHAIAPLVLGAFQAIRATATEAPMLHVVDDAQWLDSASASLLLQLALVSGVRVIATVRSGETVPDPVRRLWRDGGCERIELHGLETSEVATVLANELGDIDEISMLRLARRSRGNPLLLRELIDDAIEQGVLRHEDGVWRWHGRLRAGVRLADVIADRLAALDPDEHSALKTLAFAEPLRPDHAERLVGGDMLVALERRGVVAVDAFGDGMVRLEHPLFGEVLQMSAGALESREVHRRLISVLGTESLGPPGVAELRRARWSVASGQSLDPATLITASDVAYSTGDVEESIRFATDAIDQRGGTAASIALGRSLAATGSIEQAAAVLEPVVFDDEATPDQRAVAATSLLYALELDPSRFADARAVADRLLAELPVGDARDLVVAHWAGLLTLAGFYREAAGFAQPLLQSTVPEVVLRSVHSYAGVLLAAGRCREAVDLAMARVPLAMMNRAVVPDGAIWMSTALVTSMYFDGRLEDAQRLLSAAESALAADESPGMLGSDHRAAVLAGARARFDVVCGRLDNARVELTAAVASYRAFDPQGWMPLTAAGLAETWSYLGDAARSAEAIELAGAPGPTLHARRYEVERCSAWALVSASDTRAAIARLRAVARAARSDEFLVAETFALHDLSRLGDAAWAAPRMAHLATSWDSRWTVPFLGFATGSRTGDAGLLAEAAVEFETLGAWLWAAEAWASSYSAATDQALKVRASTAAQRGLAALERCSGSIRTPALEPLLSQVRLTTREREVAALAASGLSSKGIALQLGVSARTVDNLLSRAYSKTGVNGRKDLAEVLGLDFAG